MCVDIRALSRHLTGTENGISMTFLETLKTYPEAVLEPLCRYFDLSDVIFERLYSKVENNLDIIAGAEGEGAKRAREILAQKIRVIREVRQRVNPTKTVRAYWRSQGAGFSHRKMKPGEGARFLEAFVLAGRKWSAAHPGEDNTVLGYTFTVCYALRRFWREELFTLHLPEVDQRHLTYLSLIIDRLDMAVKDLEDPSRVVLDFYPEDDSPLDVGQYGFDLQSYDAVRDAVGRLLPAETALLAMMVRQYRRRFEALFPDVTLFQYALRRLQSDGIQALSLRALPVLMQLAEDLAPDLPEGTEIPRILEAGLVEPILTFRSQCILRYATSQAWPLASYLRLLNVHLLFILDKKRELPATEFLDLILNDTLDEGMIRQNLSKEHGLTNSVADNLRTLVGLLSPAFREALCVNLTMSLPLLDALLRDSSAPLAVRLRGTPVENFDTEGIQQLMMGVSNALEAIGLTYAAMALPENDTARRELLTSVGERVNDEIADACAQLPPHEAREAFRGLIAFWSVAVVLMRGALARGELNKSIDRENFEVNFRFIMLGVSELIRRFNLAEWEKKQQSATDTDVTPEKPLLN